MRMFYRMYVFLFFLFFSLMLCIQQAKSSSNKNEIIQPIRAFEIDRPTRILPDQDDLRTCSLILVEHSFGQSVGNPYLTKYSPNQFDDPNCRDPTKWIFIQIDFQGKAKGTQYDRIGTLQLDSIEVLRTDNPEPTDEGLIWNFSKEMNKYYDIFRKDRSLLFDLPNNVDKYNNSPLNCTITLIAYISSSKEEEKSQLEPLSKSFPIILPLSKRTTNSSAFFAFGDDLNADLGKTKLKIPRNARIGLVEIYASSTGKDESWFENIPNDVYETLERDNYTDFGPSHGPLRELQILIDDKLAGIAQPYPLIFSGAQNLFFWRPQVSYGTFNQPTYTIDITPFLGTLTDDLEHEFALKVVSAEKNQTVLTWYVTGNIQIYLDPSNERTIGNITNYYAPFSGTYKETASIKGNLSENGTLSVELRTPTGQPRTVFIEGFLKTGSDLTSYQVSWSQNITYRNKNEFLEYSDFTFQEAQGNSFSEHDNEIMFAQAFSYPLNITYVYSNLKDFQTLERGYHVSTTYSPSITKIFKEPHQQIVDVIQNSQATNFYKGDPPEEYDGYGKSFEFYAYEDNDGFTFYRNNSVYNRTLVNDKVWGTLSSKAGLVA